MPIRDEVLNWLEEAKSDLKHSKISIETGSYNWACFAAHQACEKALKSLILHVLGEYPRGYNLVKLYRMIVDEVNIDLNRTMLSRISSYYTQARYPNAGLERPSEEFTLEHAIEAYDFTEALIHEIEKIIKDP